MKRKMKIGRGPRPIFIGMSIAVKMSAKPTVCGLLGFGRFQKSEGFNQVVVQVEPSVQALQSDSSIK